MSKQIDIISRASIMEEDPNTVKKKIEGNVESHSKQAYKKTNGNFLLNIMKQAIFKMYDQ